MNVTQVSLECLAANNAQMATGDPFFCAGCRAVFNQFSQLRTVGQQQLWTCEFCDKVNEVMIEDEEMPQANEVTYLLEASAQV